MMKLTGARGRAAGYVRRGLMAGLGAAGLLGGMAAPARATDAYWQSTYLWDWSYGTNWVGGVPPVGADDLVVHFEQSSGTSTVDWLYAYLYPNGFRLNGLSFAGTSFGSTYLQNNSSSSPQAYFSFGGTNPFIRQTGAGTTTISMPLKLDVPQLTVDVTGSGLLTLSGGISQGSVVAGLTKTGAGSVVLNGAAPAAVNTNTYTGITRIEGGILQAVEGQGLPTASNLVLAGGYAQCYVSTTLSQGDLRVPGLFGSVNVFSRQLGTGANQVRWDGEGGFSALANTSGPSAACVVAIGGMSSPTPLAWGQTDFVQNGQSLKFATSGSTLFTPGPISSVAPRIAWYNSLDLNAQQQTIDVAGPVSVYALGAVKNGTLRKTGSGALYLPTGAATTITQLRIEGGSSGFESINSGPFVLQDNMNLAVVLAGGVYEMSSFNLATVTLSRSLGAGAGQVRWEGGGGFAGTNLVVNIGGQATPQALTWGQAYFVQDGQELQFGWPAYSSRSGGPANIMPGIDFHNPLDLNGDSQAIRVHSGVAALSGIVGNGGLVKVGAGILALRAANEYAGGTVVNEGSLRVSNTGGSATGSGSVTVGVGGRLEGIGAITGPVTISGTLAPGDNSGTLTVSGDIALLSGSKLEIQLGMDSAQPTAYDQLLMTVGDITLAGGLTVQVYAANGGAMDHYWIINNTGSGALTGTFTGLSNGALVEPDGGLKYRIFYGADYVTGDTSGGNDVLLLLVPEPATVVGLLGVLVLGGLRRSRRVLAC